MLLSDSETVGRQIARLQIGFRSPWTVIQQSWKKCAGIRRNRTMQGATIASFVRLKKAVPGTLAACAVFFLSTGGLPVNWGAPVS